jgi:hypothetical protein
MAGDKPQVNLIKAINKPRDKSLCEFSTLSIGHMFETRNGRQALKNQTRFSRFAHHQQYNKLVY